MNRRTFLQASAIGTMACAGSSSRLLAVTTTREIWVSPLGSDTGPGTRQHPVATLPHARDMARTLRRAAPGREIRILLRTGTYYLAEPLQLELQDSGMLDAPTVWTSAPGENAIISGGVRLTPEWTSYSHGILQTPVPAGIVFEELFVNDERQVLARYPNFDPNVAILNGYASDATSPERVARWANPAGGYLHALHQARWGGLSYRITGKNPDNTLKMKGGWQTNRPAGPHPEQRYIENIFEELDAPGEWFLDRTANILFYYPPTDLNLKTARLEAARLKHLVEFLGSKQSPVRHIHFLNLTFRHSARTFMETRETLLRTDWAIYRGGAILFRGAEDCALDTCFIDQPGGNAVFVDGYNRRITVRGCRMDRAGASSICFVGSVDAVRNPSLHFDDTPALDQLDTQPGPRSSDYPADCLVDDCLLTANGRFEKQSAGVEIDIASRITVRHATISGCPRSGINIGDGCFGGHEIDGCDIFDTVLETGDHGSFNSWGRDRFWAPSIAEINRRVQAIPDLPYLDIIEPNRLHDSRWRCDHGWDIDLDDGSSNYLIYNNLCLHGGIKLREGFRRRCTNNILVGRAFDFHAWPSNNEDVVERNILGDTHYNPALMPARPWGKAIDYNLVHIPGLTPPRPALTLQQQSGRDQHSLEADAHFVHPAVGDYKVQSDSPALGLGFTNFSMKRFGVQRASLRRLAGTPEFSAPKPQSVAAKEMLVLHWLGADVRNVQSEQEMSAYGLPNQYGAIVLSVSPSSIAAKCGIQKGDVILAVDDKSILHADDLFPLVKAQNLPERKLTIFRTQRSLTLRCH